MAENPSHPMIEWVFVLADSEKSQLGRVRHLAQVFAAEDQESIWLRGIPFSAQIPLLIRQLPIQQSYTLDEAGNLFLPHGLTPRRKLPGLPWVQLARFLPIEIPTSAFPGKTDQQWEIQMTAAREEKPVMALLTSMDLWLPYADSTPEIRLRMLQFAVSDHRKVLIMGTPLPTLPGTTYWQEESLLFPSGRELRFPFLGKSISRHLNPDSALLILFDREGNWVPIHKTDFVSASRSAIRKTAQQF